MKKCNYCDSMGPDSMDYCSLMCRSMAREEHLEGAYPRRGRAADEELKVLRAEVERLRAVVQQVHALAATEEQDYRCVRVVENLREIRKLTKA